MGTWGVAVFSDDLAADLRGDFRDLIGDGLNSTQSVESLMVKYASSIEDVDEMPVFWIALAVTQWKLGRLEERTKQRALDVIDSEQDLMRWDDPKLRKKRAAVLQNVRSQLLSLPPEPKPVRKRIKATNDWAVGEVIGLRLSSGKLSLIRVIDHLEDNGGRYAISEMLDWVGDQIPTLEDISSMSVKTEPFPNGVSSFILDQPRKKIDRARVLRLGLFSTPARQPGGCGMILWKYIDEDLKMWFDLA